MRRLWPSSAAWRPGALAAWFRNTARFILPPDVRVRPWNRPRPTGCLKASQPRKHVPHSADLTRQRRLVRRWKPCREGVRHQWKIKWLQGIVPGSCPRRPIPRPIRRGQADRRSGKLGRSTRSSAANIDQPDSVRLSGCATHAPNRKPRTPPAGVCHALRDKARLKIDSGRECTAAFACARS